MSNEYNFFGKFNVKTEKEVDDLINELTKQQSLYFLIESVKYSYEKGLFSLHESELISKSIRILYSPPKQENNE